MAHNCLCSIKLEESGWGRSVNGMEPSQKCGIIPLHLISPGISCCGEDLGETATFCRWVKIVKFCTCWQHDQERFLLCPGEGPAVCSPGAVGTGWLTVSLWFPCRKFPCCPLWSRRVRWQWAQIFAVQLSIFVRMSKLYFSALLMAQLCFFFSVIPELNDVIFLSPKPCIENNQFKIDSYILVPELWMLHVRFLRQWINCSCFHVLWYSSLSPVRWV